MNEEMEKKIEKAKELFESKGWKKFEELDGHYSSDVRHRILVLLELSPDDPWGIIEKESTLDTMIHELCNNVHPDLQEAEEHLRKGQAIIWEKLKELYPLVNWENF